MNDMFAQGDVVTLKCGGPLMMVATLHSDSPTAYCQWFTESRELLDATFAIACLVHADATRKEPKHEMIEGGLVMLNYLKATYPTYRRIVEWGDNHTKLCGITWGDNALVGVANWLEKAHP